MRSVRSILALGAVAAAAALPARAEDGWKSLFNGKDLDGWRTTGAIWKVEDGMIVGTIGDDRGSGYCMTKENYGDYEIQLECKLGYPIDTGVFLRTTDEGKAYQVTLDHRPDGFIGAIYIAGINTEGIKYLAEPPKDKDYFKKDDWNQVWIRIEGKAPHITVKVNGVEIINVTDTKERHQAEGPIGLQVHGGNVWKSGEKVWYRNLKIRPAGPPTTPAVKSEVDASKFKPGSCCDKAAKINSACAHPCCVEAAGAGKVCAKCNPGVSAVPASAAPALKFKEGSCCDKAAKAGGACSHPCCKDAEAAGKACEKCNGAGQGALAPKGADPSPEASAKGEGSPSGAPAAPAASAAVAVTEGPKTYVLAVSGMT